MLQFGLRLGERPRQMATTTPRPTKLVKRLLGDELTAVTRMKTDENRFLARGFLDAVVKRYRGSVLGRQELDGELIEDVPDALWQRAMFAPVERVLLAQSWRLLLDAWPENRIVKLPIGPLVSVTVINAVDGNGASHALGLGQFGRGHDAIMVPRTVYGMPLLQERQGIEIDFVAGFGEEPEAVPADLRQALLVLVAYWYEHRDAVIVAGSGSVVPSGFDRLVAAHKSVRL